MAHIFTAVKLAEAKCTNAESEDNTTEEFPYAATAAVSDTHLGKPDLLIRPQERTSFEEKEQ